KLTSWVSSNGLVLPAAVHGLLGRSFDSSQWIPHRQIPMKTAVWNGESQNLFARRPRQMSQYYRSFDYANLEFLELELVVVMETLKENEEELHVAERKVESERSKINHTMTKLEGQEEDLAAFFGNFSAKAEILKMEQIHEASDAIKNQNIEIEELTNSVEEKEEHLQSFAGANKLIQEKLKIVEENLNKRTMK
ncbi:hypothetical protein LINPERHAP1_LOCUS30866, partial [Linum perenne]